MGTQQLLLIVLSVIIVGISVVVSVSMFNNQAYNANQQAVAAELQQYAVQCVQYFKTPVAQGGAGQDSTIITIPLVARYIGFTSISPYSTTSDNGEFRITDISTNPAKVTLVGLGKDVKNLNKPRVVTTVLLKTGAISTTIGTGISF